MLLCNAISPAASSLSSGIWAQREPASIFELRRTREARLTLAQRNQLGNAVGFTYDQSDGNSIFHSGHVRVVRRFNRGISLNAFYQYAKSIDDSSTFGGAGNTVAQNWLDTSAERGLSSFDVRHQLSSTFVWTSPVAGPGNHMAADSVTGRLLKDWQISGGITAQTGNPLTARVLGNSQRLAQTGGTGSGEQRQPACPSIRVAVSLT